MMLTPYKIKDTDLMLDGGLREYVLKIRDLPESEKPREKLLNQGPKALTLPELLSIVLNNGTKKEGVLEMSGRIIKEYGEKSVIAQDDAKKMSEDLDIPITKACQIVACGELGRRFYEKNDIGLVTIRTAKDVYEYLRDMYTLPKEHLRGLYLNSHNRVIHDEVVSIGTINSNIVHPREVFRPAIEYGAVAVILAHNHPSGVLAPSDQDKEVTEQLIKAGKILGINVLDHVVITKNGFASVQANYQQ